MKLIVTLFLFLSILSGTQRQMLSAEYAISYAIFGKIGEAEASLAVEGSRYRIAIQAHATGVAKLMSNRRVERYESRGSVVNGKLKPEIFIVETYKGKHFRSLHRFLFDHKRKTVREIIDLTDQREHKHKEKVVDYYAQEDILTLFFNLRFYLKSRCANKKCTIVAVGANEKDGKVDITALGENRFKVILHRRIFASKEGEMQIHINRYGICDRALLKDVVFFGDVKAKATKIIYPERGEK